MIFHQFAKHFPGTLHAPIIAWEASVPAVPSAPCDLEQTQNVKLWKSEKCHYFSYFKDFYLNLEVTIYVYVIYIYIYTSYTNSYIHVIHRICHLLDNFLHLWEMPPPWGRSVQFVNAQASFVRVPSKRSCPCVQSICIYKYMYIILYHIIILCHVLLHYILWRCVILYYINFSV